MGVRSLSARGARPLLRRAGPPQLLEHDALSVNGLRDPSEHAVLCHAHLAKRGVESLPIAVVLRSEFGGRVRHYPCDGKKSLWDEEYCDRNCGEQIKIMVGLWNIY